jgi:hypothetical protein
MVRGPWRSDSVRTPDERFADLLGYPFASHFVSDLGGYSGLCMHFLDEGPCDAAKAFLCLHGQPTWSYLYRRRLPIFTDVLDLAVRLELGATNAFLGGIPSFKYVQLAKIAGRLAVDDAMHQAVLFGALGRVPFPRCRSRRAGAQGRIRSPSGQCWRL